MQGSLRNNLRPQTGKEAEPCARCRAAATANGGAPACREVFASFRLLLSESTNQLCLIGRRCSPERDRRSIDEEKSPLISR